MSKEKRTIVRETADAARSLPKIELEDLDVTQSLPKIELEDLDVTQSLPKIELEDLDVTQSLPKVEVEDLDVTRSLPKIEIEDLDQTRELPPVQEKKPEAAKPEIRIEDLDDTHGLPQVEIQNLEDIRKLTAVDSSQVSMGDVSHYLDLSTEDYREALHQASQEASAAEEVLASLGTRGRRKEEAQENPDIQVAWEETEAAAPGRRRPRRLPEEREPEGETPEEAGEEEAASARKRRRVLVAVAAVAAVAVLALGGWGISRLVKNQQMTAYYESHFLPGTWINDQDCSGMTAEEVYAFFSQEVANYSLTIQ